MMKKLLSVFVLLALLSSCGGDDPPPPNPNPAPAPTAPAPAPTTPTNPGGVFSGNCAPIGGQLPFRSDGAPYFGNLQPYDFQGSQSNSLTLDFFYYNYGSGEDLVQSVVASGTMNWPDLLLLGNSGYGTPQAQPYNFCVSSADVTSGSVFPGIFAAQDSSVAIVLQGIIQAPSYNYTPYNPQFPQQPAATVATPVTISIGNYPGCDAWLHNGRIIGCVQVSIGNGYSSLTYISR